MIFFIYGKTQKKHNDNFCGVQQHDVRLSKGNCAFSRSEIRFYGQITDMSKPESVCKVKSLLGGLSTRPPYIPDYVTIAAQLRMLTKKDTLWQWATSSNEHSTS